MQQLVVFSLGAEEYGIPIAQVQEVIRYSRPRAIPATPRSIRGVIDLRGRLVPVHDLKERLGLAPAATAESKIVIVEVGTVTAGVVVDDVEEVLTVDETQLETARTAHDGSVAAVAQVGHRPLVLLDLRALISGEGGDAGLLAA